MKLTPVLTEKSLAEAKEGHYSFWVLPTFKKGEIKSEIERVFEVHVTGVSTMNYKGGSKRNARGKMQEIKAGKKVVVSLKGDEKIDLFEEKKGKKK